MFQSAENSFKTNPQTTPFSSGGFSESEQKLLLCKGNHNDLNSILKPPFSK